jgi:hypothetical protein
MSKPRLIAFYLPQFYPTKENDEWWQKGFTEWTNVGNAKPLFRGHYQPRVPADLGYYDLRVPEVREQQAELAKEAGIEGFCYWHYWFAGRRLLDKVFNEVVETSKPDFPFCLCWANHSWYQKTWDPTKPDRLLIEQTYPGEKDYIDHFNAMLPAFKDERYIKVNGKLLYGIYSPMDIPDFKMFKSIWNDLAKQSGLGGFVFFGFTYQENAVDELLGLGYDYVSVDYLTHIFDQSSFVKKAVKKLKRYIDSKPNKVYSYDDYAEALLNSFDANKNIWPTLLPNYDHSPRSANRGIILHDFSPEKWKQLCKQVFDKCKNRNIEENLVFVKAWNEWGEGNYMEPDLRFGKGFITKTKEALDTFHDI